MSTLATLFVVVLLLNLIPAFAPPTWIAMSWVGFNIPEGNPVVFAVVAASAATIRSRTRLDSVHRFSCSATYLAESVIA
jgi:hypothetical protein